MVNKNLLILLGISILILLLAIVYRVTTEEEENALPPQISREEMIREITGEDIEDIEKVINDI